MGVKALVGKLRLLKLFALFGTAGLAGFTAVANGASLQISSMFSSGMVLQQKMADPIWGWATPGATVTIKYAGRTIQTKSNTCGEWMAKLPKLNADDHPLTLAVTSGGKRITFSGILVGDVWLCTGQSNMQYPMAGWFGRKNLAPILAKAHHKDIRLYHVPTLEKYYTGYLRSTVNAHWQLCTPKTTAPFSAVGYMFGRRLEKKLHIPIGLVESDWGGTNIEAWIPAAGYRMVPQLQTDNRWLEAMLPRVLAEKQQYIHSMVHWSELAAACLAHRLPLPPKPQTSDAIRVPYSFHYNFSPVGWQPDGHQNPTTLFNGMIAPLIPYGIRGVIWYQGENNVLSHDQNYYYHLKALIGGWRKLWHQGVFPFYIMQIAPFKYWQGGSYEPLVWQAQEKAAETIKNCGIAPTMDIGELNNIHPKYKPAAARRIADLALAKTYHMPGYTWSGAMFKSATLHGGHVIVMFVHTFGGLTVKGGGSPDYFELAGNNGVYTPADASISGKTVVLSSPAVTRPAMVRFAWKDVAVPNLFNRRGWPALPFDAKIRGTH